MELTAFGQFAEQNPDQKALCDYHGQRIRLPGDPALWPNPVHLAWHRKKSFKEPEEAMRKAFLSSDMKGGTLP